MSKFVRLTQDTEGNDIGSKTYIVKSVSKNGKTVRVFEENKPEEILTRRVFNMGTFKYINVTNYGSYATLVN